MKQTKEQLLAENERLKAEIEKLAEDLKLDEEISRERREIFSKILGAGYNEISGGFSMMPERKPVIFTWMEISCEIGKFIERSSRFESIGRVEKMEELVEQLRLSNNLIFKRLDEKQNENRN